MSRQRACCIRMRTGVRIPRKKSRVGPSVITTREGRDKEVLEQAGYLDSSYQQVLCSIKRPCLKGAKVESQGGRLKHQPLSLHMNTFICAYSCACTSTQTIRIYQTHTHAVQNNDNCFVISFNSTAVIKWYDKRLVEKDLCQVSSRIQFITE